MTDPRANTDSDKKKIVNKNISEPKPGKDVDKEGDEIPDVVKGIVASSAKRPELNDPTGVRTESDDEDLDFGDWTPPTKEEEDRARREKN